MNHNQCIYCKQILSYDLSWEQLIHWRPISPPQICQACESIFQTFEHSDSYCKTCQSPLYIQEIDTTDSPNHTYCYDCFRWLKIYPEKYLFHQAIYRYDDAMRDWLSRYKYQGDYRLAIMAQKSLTEFAKQYKEYKWLILPSSPQSLSERGFHSIATLLDFANIPYFEPFNYIGSGEKQAKKSREERIKLQTIFEMKADFQIPDQHLLLFDDVYTTGATLLQAKKTLYNQLEKEGKTNNVISLSFAQYLDEN